MFFCCFGGSAGFAFWEVLLWEYGLVLQFFCNRRGQGVQPHPLASSTSSTSHRRDLKVETAINLQISLAHINVAHHIPRILDLLLLKFVERLCEYCDTRRVRCLCWKLNTAARITKATALPLSPHSSPPARVCIPLPLVYLVNWPACLKPHRLE